MARYRGSAETPGGDPNGTCRMDRDDVRLVQIMPTPPTDERQVDRGGSDRLIAAIAAVIRDAMAADAAAGVGPPPSDDDEE